MFKNRNWKSLEIENKIMVCHCLWYFLLKRFSKCIKWRLKALENLNFPNRTTSKFVATALFFWSTNKITYALTPFLLNLSSYSLGIETGPKKFLPFFSLIGAARDILLQHCTLKKHLDNSCFNLFGNIGWRGISILF